MKPAKLIAVLAVPVLLSGCLEVEQHPTWVKGEYAGKKDNRPFETHFHHDRLSWWAHVQDRNMNQNEYNRANP